MKLPVVVDADDVARIGFLHVHALVGHEGKGIGNLHLAPFAQVLHLHAGRVAPRADAKERNAVAVVRIHVGLDLEDKAREALLIRIDLAHRRVARLRLGRPVDQRLQNVLDAKVVHARTKEDGALFALEELLKREGLGCTLHELDCLAHRAYFHREEFVEARIVEPLDQFGVGGKLLGARRKAHEVVVQQRKDAAEGLAHADGPGDRHALEL